jgi:hypothetical protein
VRAAIAGGGLSALEAALAAAPREVREGGVGAEARARRDRLLGAQQEAERAAKQEAAAEAARLAAAKGAGEAMALHVARAAAAAAAAAAAKVDALDRAIASGGEGGGSRAAGPSQAREARDVPDDFICPSTSEIMTDPVSTSDGFTYTSARPSRSGSAPRTPRRRRAPSWRAWRSSCEPSRTQHDPRLRRETRLSGGDRRHHPQSERGSGRLRSSRSLLVLSGRPHSAQRLYGGKGGEGCA